MSTVGSGNINFHWTTKEAKKLLEESKFKNLERLNSKELIHLASCINNGIAEVFARKELNKIK